MSLVLWLTGALLGYLLLRPLLVTGDEVDPYNLTKAATVLRERYIPGMNAQLRFANELYSRLEKAGQVVGGGRHVDFELEAQPNFAVAGAEEGDDLPEPKHAADSKAQFWPASIYQSIALEGALIDALAENPGSSIDEMDRQIRAAMKGFRVIRNITSYGNGSGLLATCISAADAGGKTTITCNASLNQPGVTNIRPRMAVAVLLLATGDDDDGIWYANVETVDKANHTITLDRTVTSAAGIDGTHGVFLARVDSASAYNKMPYGLGAVVSESNPEVSAGVAAGNDPDGFYGHIDRDTYDWFQGRELNNGGSQQQFTPDLFEHGIQLCEEEGGIPDLALLHPTTWRTVNNALFPLLQWQGSVKKSDAGYRFTTWNGIDLVRDFDCQLDTILILSTKSLTLIRNGGGIHIRNKDGLTWRSADRKDRYVCDLVLREQLACSKPNANCRISDIATRVLPTQS